MYYGLSVPNVGRPDDFSALAIEAEGSGWDGFFVWDHLHFDRAKHLDILDPAVLLALVGLSTRSVRLGPMVLPLARRRPWKAAKEIVTLDHLTNGRVIVGVGLGVPAGEEFGAFGEPAEDRQRAEILDEALEVFASVCSGKPFIHHGTHFQVDAHLLPATLQVPRPPVWIASMGLNRGPVARAAKWDGIFGVRRDTSGLSPREAETLRDVIGRGADFTIATLWRSDARPSDLASAGVNWLIIQPQATPDWISAFRPIVRAGPPT
jgi:alkanesulfonate monooxygenase SsuD/methylene tetrahydromethanopterin reductase-like flavin-dependent oxidoreductase (luciferase family)